MDSILTRASKRRGGHSTPMRLVLVAAGTAVTTASLAAEEVELSLGTSRGGANIAQMVNVLQAMIITHKERMVLTPTYHVFKMYVPFQDATFVPVTFGAGTYTHGSVTLPRLDAIAARDTAGKLWLALTNLDPNRPVEIGASLAGIVARAAAGETLTAPRVDSVNTFAAPETVVPKPIAAKVQEGMLSLTLEPKSVTVISIEQ
jgi:alpha-N-arabinofuranosidase